MTSIVPGEPHSAPAPNTAKKVQAIPANLKKKKSKISPTNNMTTPGDSRQVSPVAKRRKSQHAQPIHDSSLTMAMDSTWQTILAFRTSFGKGFQRVLDRTYFSAYTSDI